MTIAAIVGQRLDATTPRYIKHPASASGPWLDGSTLDAGFAQIVDNNLAHLCNESVNPLIQDNGPGLLYYQTDGVLQYTAVDGSRPPDGTVLETLRECPWYNTTSRPYGPFRGTVDSLYTNGTRTIATIRTMRFVATCGVGTVKGSTTKLYVAMTSSSSPPLVDPGSLYLNPNPIGPDPDVWTIDFASDTWPTRKSLTLQCKVELSEARNGIQYRCRKDATYGDASMSVREVPLYLWVGWSNYGGSGNPAAQVGAISCYEVR